jgi:2-oxoglutarate dehydrogenase E2 component (dihydrolipoamide succinyltransferase)
VLRHAERMTFAAIERAIADFSRRAQGQPAHAGGASRRDLTISTGGVLRLIVINPMVNPPQSAILGLHAIQESPGGRPARSSFGR